MREREVDADKREWRSSAARSKGRKRILAGVVKTAASSKGKKENLAAESFTEARAREGRGKKEPGYGGVRGGKER